MTEDLGNLNRHSTRLSTEGSVEGVRASVKSILAVTVEPFTAQQNADLDERFRAFHTKIKIEDFGRHLLGVARPDTHRSTVCRSILGLSLALAACGLAVVAAQVVSSRKARSQ